MLFPEKAQNIHTPFKLGSWKFIYYSFNDYIQIKKK